MSAFYNEHDPKAAAWLRELIKEGHIAEGVVSEADVRELDPKELEGYTQVHLFAGIGGWSYALRLADWPDDREVWTGSCPCQPFSVAGAQRGIDDPRHLWPAFFRLIEECRPPVIFGEQVEAAIRHGWLDLVQTDLEGIEYAFGATGLPAACVGAPHRRARVWFVAATDNPGLQGRRRTELSERPSQCTARTSEEDRGTVESGRLYAVGSDVADTQSGGQRIDRRASGDAGHADEREQVDYRGRRVTRNSPVALITEADILKQLDDAISERAERTRTAEQIADAGCAVDGVGHTDRQREGQIRGVQPRPGVEPTRSPWADLVWLPCRDSKARPTQSGLQPLAHGVSARVGRLRGYGNAIVPQVAAEVIRAYMEVRYGQDAL